ncbi:MAG: zinc transporter ZupT [Defluviitaleaceae bacterium]|nr:zinc transporter ZupT [Defluviitaleaceae bacterium]
MSNTFFALVLTLIAGLSTGVGGLVVLFSKVSNTKFLSVCLSFSAGVMLYIAFGEILLEAFETLEYMHDEVGYLIATVAFFGGILVMAIIDKFVPHDDKVAEFMESAPLDENQEDLKKGRELKRTGIMSAIAIAVHNFPEGIITFMAAVHDPALGIAIAIAIIIHNIPEALAMASPIYFATGSKAKAFFISLGAGMVQPLGALVAWFLLQNVYEGIGTLFGITFAAVAGIMVFVAMHQLLPAARKFGKHHMVMKWLFLGMGVMALSLVALEFVL